MSVDEFLDKAMYSIDHGCTEIHSVGGLHPKLPFEYYLDMLRGLKKRMPQVHLKFFTAVEIHHFARIFKMSIEEVLIALREAGLDSLPGGGAEIFAEETREKICPGKLSAEGWLEVHDIAHRLGISTNATMLYGHLETTEDRVDHLIQLREQQDKSGGFVTFIPLGVPSRKHTNGLPTEHVRFNRPAKYSGVPSVAGQFPAHQSVLDYDRTEDRTNRAEFWCR